MIVAKPKPNRRNHSRGEGQHEHPGGRLRRLRDRVRSGGNERGAGGGVGFAHVLQERGERRCVDEISLTRQCDRPYVAQLEEKIGTYDVVVSLACGAGVQFLAQAFRGKPILPGVNTCFIGVAEAKGEWTERRQACGEYILATTGGICPIARCSKRMSNGPCGGSSDGKCEVNKEIACGWHLIYERLKELGQLDRFERPTSPKKWSTSRDGGPRKVVKEVSQI